MKDVIIGPWFFPSHHSGLGSGGIFDSDIENHTRLSCCSSDLEWSIDPNFGSMFSSPRGHQEVMEPEGASFLRHLLDLTYSLISAVEPADCGWTSWNREPEWDFLPLRCLSWVLCECDSRLWHLWWYTHTIIFPLCMLLKLFGNFLFSLQCWELSCVLNKSCWATSRFPRAFLVLRWGSYEVVQMYLEFAL